MGKSTSTIVTDQNKSIFKRDLNNDSDVAHVTSFGKISQTKLALKAVTIEMIDQIKYEEMITY